MKSYFHIRTFILIITVAVSFFFLSRCNRPGHYDGRIIIHVPEKIADIPVTVLRSASSPKSKSEIKESFFPAVPYKNIVIPGNTMRSAEFFPGKKNSLSIDGASIRLNPGCLTRPEILSITGLNTENTPPIPPEIANVTGKHAGYRFLPHGIQFDSVAVIAIEYDTTLIPVGYTADDIFTFYFDDNDLKWKALERKSIDHSSGLIISGTLHFTDMINGIIQIPESPETNGFVPTTINDIKAADPAEGITFIAPPAANNEGDAELSYPIKLPEGRGGIEPKLMLQYSSDGSNGWAGYGWVVDIPGISVDVTWGVPRYLNDKESETYLYGGIQLNPVAHRGEYADRVPDKRFYSRVEGNFNKIIRHGNNPGNYWWEVTTKRGVSNFYGGLPETGVITSAVSYDAAGNIGFWALTKTIDLHGNFVSYSFDKPEGGGQQIYIREIAYTGHEGGEGPYKVTFLRNDETNTFVRRDTRINGRYGFILRDSELLRRINITFNNDPVRSYSLKYREGMFMKSLLESITELDAAGNEFYTHRFNYYDDVHVGNNPVPFAEEKSWALPDDGLKSPFLNIFLNSISALGGSGSWGASGSFATTVGLFDGKPYSKSLTAGGNVVYMHSNSEGLLALTDLNGDGLPDKVFKTDDGLYYRPNLLSYPSEEMFGEKKLINGISEFSASKFSGFGGGAEAHPFIGFLGYSRITSKTETKVYFEDFNGDGLVDLVKNNLVYFNHLNENGDPSFTVSSQLTPNPLYANSDFDLSILPDPAEEQARLEAQFPLHDAVRMFRAPYSGVLRINAPVSLVEDTSSAAVNDTLRDGVIVSIQHRGNQLWREVIGPDDSSVKIPPPGPIAVSKGDNIYFRVQSLFNGSYDKVYWDPELLYETINGSDTLTELKDSNGKRIGRYKASEDFVLCGQQYVGMPKTGAVRIKTEFSGKAISDTIKLMIERTDTSGLSAIIFYREYDCSLNLLKDSINLDLEVLKDEFIRFRVLSSTAVDWSGIRWDTHVEYTRIDDGTPVATSDGKPLLSFKAVPEFSVMFNNIVRHELPVIADTSFMLSSGLHTVDNQLHPVKITPDLLFNLPGNDTVTLSVKSGNKISGKKKYHLNGNTLSNTDTLYAAVRLGDTLYFEYHISDFNLAQSNVRAEVVIGSGSLNPLKASVFSAIRQEDLIFGSLHRGWGQFDYNGNSERSSAPIDESLLRLSDMRNDDIGNMQDTTQLNSIQNPQGDVFNMMIPYAEKGSYMGTDPEVFVQPEYISSSRLGEKNVYVEPVKIPASGLSAYSKENRNKSNSVAAGISPFFLSGSASYSWENGNMTIDMMDMNGDRYPDLLTSNKIKYTGVQGVLSGDYVNHYLGDHYSESSAVGFTLGGSYVHAKSDNSGTPAAAKNSKANIGNSVKNNKNANSAQETSKSSIGISGNFSTNNDETSETWLDINGDGLPDKIFSDGRVNLNLGYSFAPSEQWNFDAICKGESSDYGVGLGVNIDNGSIVAGVGVSTTDNESSETFMDINSDGLPDMVKGNNVSFNTGSSFALPVVWPGLGALNEGQSVGQSANAGFTIVVTIPAVVVVIKLCFNPVVSASSGVSHTLTQLADIDGDGMSDFLSSDREDQVKVKSSRIYRTNLLESVENPLGSRMMLDYLLTPAIYSHPGGKMAIKSVKVFDGLAGDGSDTSYTSFGYEDGFYDRHERVFYGFSSVKTHFHNTGDNNNIYRTAEQKFGNTDYYTRGKLLAETLSDGEGHKQLGTQNIYTLYSIRTGQRLPGTAAQSDSAALFVALDETNEFTWAGASEPQISTRVKYAYDAFGNISSYTDYSSGNEKDKYSVAIQYHHDAGNNIYSVPSGQEVTTFEGIRRKSETDVNSFGDITQVRKFVSDVKTVKFDMEYDEYGNLVKITRPANYKGERMWYEYDYDEAVHTWLTGIRDAYGYNSSSIYDYRWGLPVEITDRNNQKILYSIDERGRISTLTGPYQIASGKPYTIAFDYHPEAAVPYARTRHYDSIYDSDIETYSFTDGLGRPVQVKKDALSFVNPASEDTQGFIVSGKVLYDAFGRLTGAYQPTFEAGAGGDVYSTNKDNIQPAAAEFDVLDRIKRITLPDGSVTLHNYSIRNYMGERMYADSLTDAMNNVTVKYNRANGRLAALAKKSGTGDVINKYEYNGIGELLNVTDPLGNQTNYGYNMSGIRIFVNNPDAGLTEFIYDDAGNTLKKITANLRKQIPEGGAINYKYEFERLTEIVYPRNIHNRVTYTYGSPGASFNRAGRVVLVEDATGGQEFFYDRLGQVAKSIRTVQIGESDMRTWIWSATWDTWNRVQTMSYPDGEKVVYRYNRAGNLRELTGEKLGRTYSYISRIGYNKYEKQLYVKYGNGSETTYSYEPERQRLKQLNVTSNSLLLMSNSYNYDAVSNILDITGNAKASGNIGGAATHDYSYDELYRLTRANGTFTGGNETGSYKLSVQYDPVGKILQKTQVHDKDGKRQDATTYDFGYKYGGLNPGAPTEIGHRTFSYDANGNQTGWQDTLTNDFRQLLWDEENRLALISDNGYLNQYVYDASDNRIIKSHGGSQGVYINGAPVGIINHSAGNYTVYVSPYFVFRNGSFTKHYYAGSTRVASKIGNGQFQNQYRPGVFEMTAGKVNYINRQQKLIQSKDEFEKQSGIAPGPPTLKGVYADPAFTGTAYPDAGSPNYTAPRGWPKRPIFAPPGGPPGAPVQWGDNVTNDNVTAGFGFVGNGNFEEALQFFCHTDHLGSVSYITGSNGKISQFIAYMPFGETFTEQHTSWDSPYKFNAMEMDGETGLYYHGARYYDPKVSLWLNVDPSFEKRPSLSPYLFRDDNPLMDKTNGIDEQSAFPGFEQMSARRPVRTYLLSTVSSVSAISNLSALFKAPDFHDESELNVKGSTEDNPLKKRNKRIREAASKKLGEPLREDKRENEGDKNPKQEIEEAADVHPEKEAPAEMKQGELKPPDEVKPDIVPEQENINKPEVKIEVADVIVPEKATKLEITDKKDDK